MFCIYTGAPVSRVVWLTAIPSPDDRDPPPKRFASGKTLHRPACGEAGSAGPLRGRKRDVWEGGHRVPGIVSWPAVAAGGPRTTWDTVVTMDFHATVMEVLNVSRPAAQRDWHYDGVSILPILKVSLLLQLTVLQFYFCHRFAYYYNLA